jgi:hypothetical protein
LSGYGFAMQWREHQSSLTINVAKRLEILMRECVNA